jgi:hypothetical protein
MFRTSLWTAAVVCLIGAPLGAAESPVFRIGIIGLDTSHVPAFTGLINDPAKNTGFKVVAGFPGGSPAGESSATRGKGDNDELRETTRRDRRGAIEELCRKVDGVMPRA